MPMKSKKGLMLGEEVVELIISAIVLLSLIAFLAFLYYSYADNNWELDFAKSSLKYLINNIESQKKETLIFGPKDWVIGSWVLPSSDLESKSIPPSCKNFEEGSCICFCKCTNGGCNSVGSSSTCDPGVCYNLKKNVVVSGYLLGWSESGSKYSDVEYQNSITNRGKPILFILENPPAYGETIMLGDGLNPKQAEVYDTSSILPKWGKLDAVLVSFYSLEDKRDEKNSKQIIINEILNKAYNNY